MSSENARPADPAEARQLQVSIGPNPVEFLYRDAFALFVGPEEVILEFGNRSRQTANAVTISTRVVLSLPNAVRLSQAFLQGLAAAQKQAMARQEAPVPAGIREKQKS